VGELDRVVDPPVAHQRDQRFLRQHAVVEIVAQGQGQQVGRLPHVALLERDGAGEIGAGAGPALLLRGQALAAHGAFGIRDRHRFFRSAGREGEGGQDGEASQHLGRVPAREVHDLHVKSDLLRRSFHAFYIERRGLTVPA